MNINEFISTSRELKKTFEDSKLSHRWIKYFVSNGFYLENQFLGKCCSCNTQIFIKEAIKNISNIIFIFKNINEFNFAWGMGWVYR